MPKVTLHLDGNGKLEGISERDQKAWTVFVFKTKNLGDGSLSFQYCLPRSGPFHRRFFKMLATLFESQDAFTDFDMFRTWLTVGAGYAQFLPDHNGEMIAFPKSIAYEKLDQVEFKEIADKVFDYAQSEHARLIMWPHMSPGVSGNMIAALFGEFE